MVKKEVPKKNKGDHDGEGSEASLRALGGGEKNSTVKNAKQQVQKTEVSGGGVRQNNKEVALPRRNQKGTNTIARKKTVKSSGTAHGKKRVRHRLGEITGGRASVKVEKEYRGEDRGTRSEIIKTTNP